MRRLLPILTVLLLIVLIWYAAAAKMNAAWSYDQAARAGGPVPSAAQIAVLSMNQERPVLPTPHQVAVELVKSTLGIKVSSKKYSAATSISRVIPASMAAAFNCL